MDPLASFLEEIRNFQSPGVFNPWRDVDPENDLGPVSPQIRLRHLSHYLKSRLGKAKLCLLGEALSYQGGHFAGIAMMSERILLGHCREKGILPEAVLPGLQPERSSRPDAMPNGFAEPTASIVWGFMTQAGIPGTDFLTWNSFAWHPYKIQEGILTNRRPSLKEAEAGLPALRKFLALFPGIRLIAVGQTAQHCLGRLGIQTACVRHPAMGGANLFRAQMAELLQGKLTPKR